MLTMKLCLLIYHLVFIHTARSFPDEGKWQYDMKNKVAFLPISKSLYKGSQIYIDIGCSGEETKNVRHLGSLQWMIRATPCWEEYLHISRYTVDSEWTLQQYFDNPQWKPLVLRYEKVSYVRSEVYDFFCDGTELQIPPFSESLIRKNVINFSPSPNTFGSTGDEGITKEESTASSTVNESAVTEKVLSRKKGGLGTSKEPVEKINNANKNVANTTKLLSNKTSSTLEKKSSMEKSLNRSRRSMSNIFLYNDTSTIAKTAPVYKIPNDDIYLLIVKVTNPTAFTHATVKIKMKGEYGYLSAADWPLLPFYSVMCGVYTLYGIAWLIMCFLNWRDLLRIQFWIGSVIFLGMLEVSLFLGEYTSLNSSGQSIRGSVLTAEIVSSGKRALSRMLIIIVALGFGIVKPRLGLQLRQVMLVGGLYFVIGAFEGCLRGIQPKNDPSKAALLAAVPLAIIDAGICYWIFMSLYQTLQALKLRRNLVKLLLYRRFANCLIFSILASIAFLCWQIKIHRLQTCITDWKNLWFDEAFWHILFAFILLVIMFLWRPSINSQRFAADSYTKEVNLDDSSEEEEAALIPSAFEGLSERKRSLGKIEYDPEPQEPKFDEDEIETGPEDLIPNMLNSDEEQVFVKLEESKIE